MSIFYQEEAPSPSKRCKCLASALKDAFAKCHSFRGKLPYSSPPELEETASNFDQEDEIFISAVISKYMESKGKRKSSNCGIDSFYWALSEDPIFTPKEVMKRNENDGDEFFSAGSHLSSSSAATSFDDAAFVSAKTCFSRCSSFSSIDEFQDFIGKRRRSIILEFIHCEGWPFGLCRKALLLPPLPKSPADSWLWWKSGKLIKINA